MDKRRRDSNSPSSESGRQKGARETSPAVAAPVEKGRQHVRPIRTETSSDVFQALKSSCKWLHFLGPDIPPGNEHSFYDISGWKTFVDTMANDINEENSDMYDGHLNLFIACAHVFRCSPITLLSPRRGLCYDIPTADKTSVDGTTSLWSQTPIRLLTQILTHPILRGNKDHLAKILQYAVILSQLPELIVILSLIKSKPSSSSSLSKQGQQSTPLPSGRNKLHYSWCSVGLSPCFGIGTSNQETLVATRSAQRTGWRTDTPALAATRPVMIGNKQPPSCAKTKTNAKAVD